MSRPVRLTQLDGKLPNLALMKLAAWHRERGDDIHYYRGDRGAERHLGEPDYSRVYGSAIFAFSAPLLTKFRQQFPEAIVGGTGTDQPITVEQIVGGTYERYDYSAAPAEFKASIGFTQRGCRLKCKFCVVPGKEGKPHVVNSIRGLWRGTPWPKQIHLLDNDFFGQPKEDWEARIAEIREGDFKVCFNQGLNVRLIDDAAAQALASIEYRDDSFQKRRLYTAWDNLKDEKIFMRGVDTLERAGVPPQHLMAYMLVGFDPSETWERLFHRFRSMVARGIRPYPMVYGDKQKRMPAGGHNGRIEHRTLGEFQRWVVTGLYRAVEFDAYDSGARRTADRTSDMFAALSEAKP